MTEDAHNGTATFWFAPVAAAQASEINTTQRGFVFSDDLTDKIPPLPALTYNNSVFPSGRLLNRSSDTEANIGLLNAQKSQINIKYKSTVSSREKRNTDDPFAPPSGNCEVTEGELTKLADALQRATEELSGSAVSQPARNLEGSCTSVISYILNYVNYIVKQAKLLKQVELVDTNMYEALKAESTRQLAQCNTIIDNLKRTLNQEKSTITNEFNTRLAGLQEKLNDSIEKIYNLKVKNNEMVISLCASQIKNKEYQMAFTEFKSLDNNTKLVAIVKRAYDGNLDNLEKILEFLKILPSCTQDAIAFPALFNLMKTNYHLNSPKVLLFSDAMSQCIRGLVDLNTQLTPFLNNVIGAWATKIRSGDHEQIKLFASQSVRASISISNYLPNIIKVAYANTLGNFDKILRFVNDLPWRSHLCKGYASLLNEMKNNYQLHNSEIITLAYKTKQAMEMNGDATVAADLKESFESLKSQFPIVIRNLIWNGVCTIRNTHYNEFLYAAGENFMSDIGDRQVFTWIPGGEIVEGDWKFEPIGDATSFFVKNKFWNNDDYLAQDTHNAYDYDRNTVVTCNKNSAYQEKEWKLEPVTVGGANYFRIKNTIMRSGRLRDVYLYTAGSYFKYDSSRRRVFTWTPGDPVIQGDWELNCYN